MELSTPSLKVAPVLANVQDLPGTLYMCFTVSFVRNPPDIHFMRVAPVFVSKAEQKRVHGPTQMCIYQPQSINQ